MIQAWLLPLAFPLFTQMQAPATPQGQRLLPAWSFSRAPSSPDSPPSLQLLPLTSILSSPHFLAVELWASFTLSGLWDSEQVTLLLWDPVPSSVKGGYCPREKLRGFVREWHIRHSEEWLAGRKCSVM